MRGRRGTTVPALVLAMVGGGLRPVAAQEKLEVDGPEPSTIRLGDSARVVIRVEGRTANPRPFKVPDVDGLRIEVSGPLRSGNMFYDGRSIIERVGVQYQLELRPQRDGSFVVPPFPIWTGSQEQRTRELRIEVKRDLRGEELGWLDVAVEPRSVYVHEPVRIRVDFGVQHGVRLVTGRANNGQPYFDVEVQASWLEQFPGGEPIETPLPPGNQQLIVRSNQQLMPVGYEPDFERNGARWQRFSFERAVLPTRLGKIELPAPMLRYHVLRREGRPDVGMRRGGASENFYVYGKPIAIDVKPIPEAGRPTPFYGAVGRFTIEAALDRDQVRVGNSVKLTLTVRGRGNHEFLRLPAIEDLAGFHKLGQAEAKRDADKVVVTYDLTPLSTDVGEVPAIAWNFFDTTPGVEKFVEVATKPLPLSVQPLANAETLLPLPDSVVKAVTPGVDDIFDLPELSLPPRRVAAETQWHGWVAVFGPWLLALAGRLGFRRYKRAAADVQGQRARAAHRQCRLALDRGDDPLVALTTYLGDRLAVPAAAIMVPDLATRLERIGLPAPLPQEVGKLVEQGTAARYGAGAGLDAASVRDLVARLERVRLAKSGGWSLLLLPLLFAFAGGLRAQSEGVAAAVESYRAGDYHSAEAEFAKAYAASEDRRLLQARGNCLFRLGDLPRALWAYESARLGLPRERELLANIALVRQQLELGGAASGFVAELTELRTRLSRGESLALCALGMGLCALCFVCGWRRVGWRWVGVLVLLPTAWLAVDVLGLRPALPRAVALQKLELTAEPRAGMPATATVRPGVLVDVLGGGQGAFVRVQAGERSGYVERDAVALVQ